MFRVYLFSLLFGAATFLGGYGLSDRLDRDLASEAPPSPSKLRVIQASPINTEKMQAFREGMGFNP